MIEGVRPNRTRTKSRRLPRTYALLATKEIMLVIIISIVGAIALASGLHLWSLWFLLGFASFVAPLAHFCFVGARSLAFPLFLPAIFSFQHVVSSAYLYEHPSYLIKSKAILSLGPEYFPLAVLIAWGMYFGVVLPIFTVKPLLTWHKDDLSAHIKKSRYVKVLEITFWLSISLGVLVGVLNIKSQNIAFMLLLLSKLSYVSVVALGVIRSKRFNLLLIVLAAVEIQKALVSTIFHPVLFFFLMVCCLMVFSGKRWRPLKVATLLFMIALSIYMLQCIKGDYREELKWSDTRLVDRISIISERLWAFITSSSDIFSERNLGHAIDRFDQSQIVGMVMTRVPQKEPFARGETLITAMKNALVPRIFDPGKYRAGGSAFFERFTGFKRSEGTSINLGQMAEFYANFGGPLSVVACCIYSLLIGLLWRAFHNRSTINPIWWAWFPFIALQLVKTEDGLGEIINHAFKSAVVAFFIIGFVPEWKSILRMKRKPLRTNRDSHAIRTAGHLRA